MFTPKTPTYNDSQLYNNNLASPKATYFKTRLQHMKSDI